MVPRSLRKRFWSKSGHLLVLLFICLTWHLSFVASLRTARRG